MAMTSKERISRLLAHKKPDRIGLYEHFWGDTHRTWAEQGHIAQDENLTRHFQFDMDEAGGHNLVVDLDFVPEVVEETAETIVMRDGNGAVLRRHKLHDSTPEHIGFAVTCMEEWQRLAKPKLVYDARRIRPDHYRATRERCAQDGRFFCYSFGSVFELMHPVCGHENMLVGMALEPEWIVDMADTYTTLMLSLIEELFAKEGKPDGFYVYEDMGFKHKPFMSPAMYRALIMPAHKRFCDFAHAMNLPVIMHSCGFVEPLLPHMVEAGIDALQAMEVKAGMDLVRIYRNFGERIALIGGIDVRALCTNDKSAIDRELESKIPIVKEGCAFVLHTDHSIPKTVEYDTFRYYIEKGLELGTYR